MRLNRVLLLAASFSILIFAMVFTISCSGDDGKNGRDGKSCEVKENSNGNYDIYCGEEKQGELKQGPKGPKGDDAPGAVENNCVLGDAYGSSYDIKCGSTVIHPTQGGGSVPDGVCVLGPEKPAGSGKYTVVCGGKEIDGSEITGTLDACKVDQQGTKGFQLVLVCPGAELYFCSGALFDPAEDHCEARYTISHATQYTDPNKLGTGSYDGMTMGEFGTGSPYAYQYGVVVPSLCNGVKYDSRLQFCDRSSDMNSPTYTSNGTVRELCGGKYGEQYRQGAAAQLYNEKCENGKITRDCGTGTSAKRYVLATQFCEVASTGTIKDRCGTPTSSGVYNVGKYQITNWDRTYDNSGSRSAGAWYKGEYSTANGEVCVDGKVVKLCGGKQYEEQTHFCAVGDVIAPHCTDRQIYDPSTQYCSFMGNSWQLNLRDPEYPGYPAGVSGTTNQKDRNIQAKPADGFYNYGAGGYSDDGSCKLLAADETGTGCMQYASTAIEFCGTPATAAGSAPVYGVANKPNEGSWRWEYCRDMDLTSAGTPLTEHSPATKGSIIRCAELQVPPTGTGNTCQCILNAIPISTTTNGCKCVAGWKFDGSTVTGRFNNNGKPVTSDDIATITSSAVTSYSLRYDGGACYPQLSSATACSAGEVQLLDDATGKYRCATLACGSGKAPIIQGYIANSNYSATTSGVTTTTSVVVGNTYACIADVAATETDATVKVNTLCGTTGSDTRIIIAGGSTASLAANGGRCVDYRDVDLSKATAVDAAVNARIYKCNTSYNDAAGKCN